MKFSIMDFCSKYDKVRRNLRIWSHLLKTFLVTFTEEFFCAVKGKKHAMIDLCLSTKFPHREIRWNYGILRSVLKAIKRQINENLCKINPFMTGAVII